MKLVKYIQKILMKIFLLETMSPTFSNKIAFLRKILYTMSIYKKRKKQIRNSKGLLGYNKFQIN